MNHRRPHGSRPSGPNGGRGRHRDNPRNDRHATPPARVDGPRDRVHERLVKLVQRFPELPLGSVDTRGLEPRDAAFARAQESAVLERWITLEAIICSQLDRGWSTLQPAVRAALLTGTAEILLLDSVPDHAAINETVERVRRNLHQAVAGLVNAVLRKVAALRLETLDADHPDADELRTARNGLPLADGRVIRLSEPLFAEEEVSRLGEQTSHGDDLVIHWIAAHGFAKTYELCLHDLVRPPICVTATDPETLRPDAGADGPLVAHDRPGFFVLDPGKANVRSFLAEHPGSRIQDPASAEPVAGARGLEPTVVLDYCAGRGTKTRQLADAFPEARILATEVDPLRFTDLERAFEGHPTVEVVRPEALEEVIGRVDLLALDVPCTNTGVLPRRPEAKYRFSRDSLASIATLQRKIVRETKPFLAPGGAILFSTCSLEPTENRRMVAWMERRFGLASRHAAQRFPAGQPGDPLTSIHDGSFHAVLVDTKRPGSEDADDMTDAELMPDAT